MFHVASLSVGPAFPAGLGRDGVYTPLPRQSTKTTTNAAAMIASFLFFSLLQSKIHFLKKWSLKIMCQYFLVMVHCTEYATHYIRNTLYTMKTYRSSKHLSSAYLSFFPHISNDHLLFFPQNILLFIKSELHGYTPYTWLDWDVSNARGVARK